MHKRVKLSLTEQKNELSMPYNQKSPKDDQYFRDLQNIKGSKYKNKRHTVHNSALAIYRDDKEQLPNIKDRFKFSQTKI